MTHSRGRSPTGRSCSLDRRRRGRRISLGFSSFAPLRRQAIKNGVEQGHGTQSNRLGIKDLWPSATDSGTSSSQGQKRSKTQILTVSDPKIRGQDPKTLSKRAHNPLLKEAGLTKPTGAVPWLGGAIGTSGMPLTASGRERPPDSDACKQTPRSWVS